MKKILSALISATLALNAVPLVSSAEETTETSDEIQPIAMPYTIDGDSVIFQGGNDFDYIISSINSTFTTERTKKATEMTTKTMTFTPKEDGKYVVSRVWLEESIIDYSFSSVYDPETGETIYINDPIETHCHYFYPHIQNFEITYNSKTGTQVEFSGEHRYYNESTVNEKIKTNPSMACYDYMEMSTEDILSRSEYYAFVSSHLLLGESSSFLMYYDYGWNDEKDKSIYCIDYGYNVNENGEVFVDVTGNAEITKTLYGGSYIDGNFEVATCDMIPYILIEPTADGFAEVYVPDLTPMSSTVLKIEDGQFTDRFSIGCEQEIGDLNYDSEITIADAVTFQKYLIGQTDLTSTQYTCADINSDDYVDVFDMVLLRKHIVATALCTPDTEQV
ncbi:MAG: dockerin type I repeat-containing protein [Ruminococcus sp.]|nr:dockerin type I repeat-containing protein [Ruminococcus sp.]